MVSINKTSNKPYYEQLILSIKEEILQGVIRPGDQMLSIREMAKRLLMNPNTVSKAYQVLENEQILITIKGKGTFVKSIEDTSRDERRIQELKEKFKELLVEAGHLKISPQELNTWFVLFDKELGGIDK